MMKMTKVALRWNLKKIKEWKEKQQAKLEEETEDADIEN